MRKLKRPAGFDPAKTGAKAQTRTVLLRDSSTNRKDIV